MLCSPSTLQWYYFCLIYSVSYKHKVLAFTSFDSQPLSLQICCFLRVSVFLWGMLITCVLEFLFLVCMLHSIPFHFPSFPLSELHSGWCVGFIFQFFVLSSAASEIRLRTSLELFRLTVIFFSMFSIFNLGFLKDSLFGSSWFPFDHLDFFPSVLCVSYSLVCL